MNSADTLPPTVDRFFIETPSLAERLGTDDGRTKARRRTAPATPCAGNLPTAGRARFEHIGRATERVEVKFHWGRR
jgi:hypothetical protein